MYVGEIRGVLLALARLSPTFEKLFTGVKVGCRAQKSGAGCKRSAQGAKLFMKLTSELHSFWLPAQ